MHGPRLRIRFLKKKRVIPECLKRNMTAGNGGLYGRINCKEFCDEIRELAKEKTINNI